MILVEAQAKPPLFVEQDVTISMQSLYLQKDWQATIKAMRSMIDARILTNKGP